jgi:CubicO group peptidase (beta-lactamase class C family)
MIRREKLDTLVDRHTERHAFSGVVLLEDGDGDRYLRTAGYANRTHRVLNSPETRFATASVTKMFTAASIMQLIENGSIDLDTLAADYLGLSGTNLSRAVTIYHLLTHTSGMANYFDDSQDSAANFEQVWADRPSYSFRSLSAFLPLFADESPLAKPGKRFEYCDAGYIMLGLVIEKASGLSYFDYVRRNIFSKADMGQSDFLTLDGTDENVAEAYVPITDRQGRITGWRKNIFAVPVLGASDGGAFATAADMVRFLRALRQGKLMSTEMTKEMLTPRVEDQPTEIGVWKYGYGMYFLVAGDGTVLRYGHTGEDPGVSCRVYHYPGPDLDMIILGNQSECAGWLGLDIQALILEMGGRAGGGRHD